MSKALSVGAKNVMPDSDGVPWMAYFFQGGMVEHFKERAKVKDKDLEQIRELVESMIQDHTRKDDPMFVEWDISGLSNPTGVVVMPHLGLLVFHPKTKKWYRFEPEPPTPLELRGQLSTSMPRIYYGAQWYALDVTYTPVDTFDLAGAVEVVKWH